MVTHGATVAICNKSGSQNPSVYLYMERNVLKKKWYLLWNDLKERWPDLTQSDIDYVYGDHAKLVEIVEHRRHISRDEAARDVQEFLSTIDTRQRIA